MPECRRKGHETGLWYEIKCLEETIAIKEKMGEDAKFERGLLRAFRTDAIARSTSRGQSKSRGLKRKDDQSIG